MAPSYSKIQSNAAGLARNGSGGTLNIVVPDWVVEGLVKPVISVPFLFWILNMCWLGLISVGLMKLMSSLAAQALAVVEVTIPLCVLSLVVWVGPITR